MPPDGLRSSGSVKSSFMPGHLVVGRLGYEGKSVILVPGDDEKIEAKDERESDVVERKVERRGG